MMIVKKSIAWAILIVLNNIVWAQSKPNIIYILADDLGYGDVGCYGQKVIQTPNIDQMAKNGIRFTRHYAGAPVCAPSRAVLMTGRDMGHVWVRGNYEDGPHGFGAGLALRNEDVTIAEVLKERGYATGLVGKWGLGVAGTSGEPHKQGFDYSYGFLNQAHAHTHYPDYLFRNGKRIEIEENKNGHRQAYSNQLFTSEAIGFIQDHQSKPFFLYLAYTTPHAELLVPEDSIFNSYKGRFKETPYVQTDGGKRHGSTFTTYNSQPYPNAAYAASISHLDQCIGKILAYLKKNGLYENTVVIFASDNGPANEGGADPAYFNSSGSLKGKKRDVYEGGIRVPFIAQWPARIKGNTITDFVSGFQDMMPTLAQIAGAPLNNTIKTEGISLVPALTNNNTAQRNHKYLYWEFHENKTSNQAILSGKWKGVRSAPNKPLELYNLDVDPGEQNDVAAANKEVVKRLEGLLKKARTSHPLWPLKQN
jgi:arylsulfatase A-like enzyme